MLDDAEGSAVAPFPAPQEMEAYYRLIRQVGAPPSMQDLIAERFNQFKHDPEARLRKRLADEAGISYSQALERWGNPDDIAAEIAWMSLRAEDQLDRCGGCGSKPTDWFVEVDGQMQEREDGPYKFMLWDCYGCQRLGELNAELSDEDKARGLRWLMKGRKLGEPQVDGF